MFEIRLDDVKDSSEEDDEEEEEEGQGRLEVDRQTVHIRENQDKKLDEWAKPRRGWSQGPPQTLMEALVHMDVDSDATLEVQPGPICLFISLLGGAWGSRSNSGTFELLSVVVR